jgi:hypothetical protein
VRAPIARACAFCLAKIVDVSLEQPLKVLNLFLLFDRHHRLAFWLDEAI